MPESSSSPTLITAIEADLLDTPLSDVPTDWRCSDEVTRAQCYKEMKMAVCEMQRNLMESHGVEDCMPAFDE